MTSTRIPWSRNSAAIRDASPAPAPFPATGFTIDYPEEFSIFLVSTLTNDTPLPTRVYGKFGTLDLDDLTPEA